MEQIPSGYPWMAKSPSVWHLSSSQFVLAQTNPVSHLRDLKALSITASRGVAVSFKRWGLSYKLFREKTSRHVSLPGLNKYTKAILT